MGEKPMPDFVDSETLPFDFVPYEEVSEALSSFFA
jgi:hypothetical protein